MDRLLMLHLQSFGCAAEAWLNGIPLARVTPQRPSVSLPVHEFTQAGQNRLELLVADDEATLAAQPKPLPQLLRQSQGASLSLLLQPCDPGESRRLAQLNWAPGLQERIETPARLVEEVALPVNFARWRWLDAPVIEAHPTLAQRVLDWLATLACDLSAGKFDGFMAATALRTEELALAYQLKPDAEAARWLAHLQQLHAAQRLQWAPLAPDSLRLRPLAGGRLLECLEPGGGPALRSLPDANGQVLLFPLRLAAVEGRFYVLR